MNFSTPVYKKLQPSGLLDNAPINQPDYDVVVNYVKKSFPKATNMQRDIEQALKRTFVLGSNATKEKQQFTVRKRPSQKVMKKKRREKVLPIPKSLPYDRFLPMNQLWKEYIAELLRDSDPSKPDNIQQKLNRSDFHGANVSVASSNCQAFVGLEGIVIKETRNTFVIVTPTNATKTLPKSETEFRIDLLQPKGSILLAGNSLLSRPAERACKKVKSFMEFTGSKVYKKVLRYTKH